MESLGFTNPQKDISFKEYFKFLQRIEPNINESEASYIFKKTDENNSNSISVK